MEHARRSTCWKAVHHLRTVPRRLLLTAGAALLGFGVLTSFTAAAPVYGDWSAPVDIGPIVNSTVNDNAPALSTDGLSLYFYSARPGFGGNDIWVSRRATTSATWGAPVNLGPTINSSFADVNPALSGDGHWLFFGSARPGFGSLDLWASWRPDVHDDLGWQTPTNLGPNVNTSASESGAGYFEDGGAPQLFFDSARPGVGSSDLYVSTVRADGTWGPATLIPGLSSTANDRHPSVREDGLELVFFSDRAGSLGLSDLWSATRASVDAPWSAPVNLGPPVSSASDEQSPSLAADGRTLFFGASRPDSLGGVDLYMTTRDAELTVTANDQSRLFGQANPSLGYAISGFVGGDSAAVVSGAAACTTTATTSSPAGTYPITCTLGTLTAAGYAFATFVPATLTVSYTSPCLTEPHSGRLTVSAGQAVCIGAGAVQTGPVTVGPGGSLDLEGGTITGPLTATGAAVVRICGTTLSGPLTISASSGLVLVGGDAATGPCDANTVIGPVRVTDNTGGVEFNGNTVVGPLRLTGNSGALPSPDTGPVHAVGNTVTGPVTIQP